MNSITEKAINKHVELRLKFQQNTLLSQAEITDRLRALNLMNKFQFKASEEYILLSFKKKPKNSHSTASTSD